MIKTKSSSRAVANHSVSPVIDGKTRFSDDEPARMRLAVGKRLKEAFGTENVSEIARHLKSQPGVIKPYTDGSRFPSHEILFKFHRATGFSIHWLLTGEGSMTMEYGIFTQDEEQEIAELARANGRSFAEEIRQLVIAGKNAVISYLG